MMDNERCSECEYCATLYIPPAKIFDKVIEVCGGTKASNVCTLFLDEANEVQYLGSEDGMCEVFTRKK